jgi:hypothetical protein
MKTKNLPYGQKRARVLEMLTYSPDKSDKEIARRVRCHPSYVKTIRTQEHQSELRVLESEGLVDKPSPEAQGVDAILDERGSRYGPFVSHAMITQLLKGTMDTYLTQNKKTLMPDQQEALDMIFHKIGRILNGDPNYADSWIDIAGYAKLVADRLEREQCLPFGQPSDMFEGRN